MTASACGLEHEYRVLDGHDSIDFRDLILDLGLDGAGVDPADPLAHRGGWGGLITADGPEAEVASPPVRLAPGFTGRLAWWAERGEGELRAVLPPSLTLDGYSTHLSFSVPGRAVAPVARSMAERFAPALMLLLDRRESPGALIRPRAGRVEICGEYASGEHLRAAAAMAAGATLACRRGRPPLPAVRCRIEPARIRRGWYVDRAAFAGGEDLYAGGRDAVLHLDDGTSVTAGEHLRRCWHVARAELIDMVSADDLAAADAAAAGELALPCEDPTPVPPGLLVADDTPFARLGLGRRPAFDVRPVVVQWHGVAFELSGTTGAARYVWVPEPWLESFVFELAAGALDAPLAAALTAPPSRRSLTASVGGSTGGTPSVHGALGDTKALALGEPDPLTGRIGGGGFGSRSTKDAAEFKAIGRLRVRQGLLGAAVGAAVGFGLAAALGG